MDNRNQRWKIRRICKAQRHIFSVNKGGYVYAKEGTEKGEKFVEFLNEMIAEMNRLNEERVSDLA